MDRMFPVYHACEVNIFGVCTIDQGSMNYFQLCQALMQTLTQNINHNRSLSLQIQTEIDLFTVRFIDQHIKKAQS